jgi:hypothetical protein
MVQVTRPPLSPKGAKFNSQESTREIYLSLVVTVQVGVAKIAASAWTPCLN